MRASEYMMIAVLRRLCKYLLYRIYKSSSQIAFHFQVATRHASSIPSNTTFRNIDGQIIYKTESLMRYCLSRQITIKRMVPSNSIDLGKGSNNASRASIWQKYAMNFSRRVYDITELKLLHLTFSGSQV